MKCCIESGNSTTDNGLTGAVMHSACWIGFPGHERRTSLDRACSFQSPGLLFLAGTIFAMKKEEKVTW